MKNNRFASHFYPFFILIFLLPILAFSCMPNEKSYSTRKAAFSGSWYKGSKEELNKSLTEFLNAVKSSEFDGHITALISPHAGYTWSGKCAAAGFKCIQNKDYRRVFILGFSHHYPIQGAAVSVFEYYETPLGKIEVDRDICQKLLQKKDIFSTHRKAEEVEHSIENQLPFLQKTLEKFKIIPVLIGNLRKEEDYKVVASALKEFIDPYTLFVISSDFTHYGKNYRYLPFRENVKESLEALDKGAISRITEVDFKGFQKYLQETGDTICGRNPIGVLLQLLDENSKGTLLMYYRSADLTGDFSNSVSYAAIAFSTTTSDKKKLPHNPILQDDLPNPEVEKSSPLLANDSLTEIEQETLLRIARETLISHLTDSKSLDPFLQKVNLTNRMKEKRGVFVTIKKSGHLRGCIGYIEGIKPIFEAVIDNTRSASTRDYRFPPMRASEIDKVKLEISVMTPLKRIHSTNEVKVGRDGLVIEHRGKRGVLLPQVATENGWGREQFLNAICRKAGLPETTWKTEKPIIRTFSAQVFGEE